MDLVLKVLLQQFGQFVSGMTISQQVGLSRTAVWKHVQALNNEGFGIECTKKKGYRLHTLPENRWIPEKLAILCHPPLEWFYRPEVDSTNLWAKEVMVRFTKPAVFFTDIQYAGRGRLGRQWQSSPGKDIMFSLALPLNTDVCHYYQYTMMMALAVHRVISSFSKQPTLIKWPNDIYVNGKKISGILSEMLTEENRLRTLIIGVGMNVNSTTIPPVGTSLTLLTNTTFDRHVLLSETLNNFFDFLARYEKGEFISLYEEWKTHLMGLHSPVRIDTGYEVVEGELVDVNEQGIAIIKTNNHTKEISSGDLFLTK
jgi:BirA family biotin operon repressor/biotin-[acetyl-CoA-carboxylase] ligase